MAKQSTKLKPGARAQARLKQPPPVPPAQNEAPAGPRSGKGERTRERLVEAAKEIFQEQGFLNARIADIATRAEQSHGSFWYYFDSKEEVFREIAAALEERLFAPLDEVILVDSWTTMEERIREATRIYLENYRKEAKLLDLIEQVSRFDPEVNAMRLARHKRVTERVAEAIRQQQRRGIADPELDPMVAAAALGALTQRFAELWFVQDAIQCSLAHGVEQLARIYENALRPSTPPPKTR